MVGRSTGLAMGRYGGKTTLTTTIKSWKADQGGALHLTTTKESTIITIEGPHRFSNYVGRAGDSGAAVIDRYGFFVGLYFARNDIVVSDILSRRKSCLQISGTLPGHRMSSCCKPDYHNCWRLKDEVRLD